MIDSKDISIVIQGKNEKIKTAKCINSIRKYLPGSTIIFSTYKNEYVKDLDYDILVESDDPGATLLSNKMYNNINRILTTTKAGLEKVKTLYCIKMRSDLIFNNEKILSNIFEKFTKRDKNFSIFKQRVVFYPLWSRQFEFIANIHKILTPFYLSDWFCFGLTEDIKNYFEKCPSTLEPDFTNYYKKEKNRIKGFYDPNVCWRFSPEQWFCVNFFKRYYKSANMSCSQDYSEERMALSNQILSNNIIIAGYDEIGVYIQKEIYKKISKNIDKEMQKNPIWLSGIFSHYKFLKLYKQYCDSNYILPLKYRWKEDLKIEKYVNHFKKHWINLIKPIKSFVRWLDNFISVPYYFIHIIVNILHYLPRFLFREIFRHYK